MNSDRAADLEAYRQRVARGREARLAAAACPRPAPVPAKPKRPSGNRWATLNQFVDLIAPRLTLAECAVWLLLYRHARGGIVETSVRLVASQAAVSRPTAERALNRLCRAGLIRPVWKSRSRGSGSKYSLNHQPHECLQRLIDSGPGKPR